MRAAVFDFDGVIVDSEPLHYRALRDALAPEGILIDEDEYARAYLAFTDRESVRVAFERHGLSPDLARVEAVAARKADLFQELLPTVPVFPDARGLVLRLVREVPLAIASGGLRAEIEALLDATGLRDAFALVVAAEDAPRGKPDPEPYLVALRRLQPRVPGLRAQDCLVVEDSVAGIAAGLAAGMKVVAVAHTYPAAKLQAAHRVVSSLEEVDGESVRSLFA